MKNNKIIFTITVGLLLALMIVHGVWALTTAGDPELPAKHIIENVPFMPEIKGGCAISAFRMQLAYYGTVYAQTSLMNLSGWDYAFEYYYPYGWVSLEPVSTVKYMAVVLGCTVEYYSDQTFEDAWRTLKGFIAQDKPVFIQWPHHSVLAVGYDDEDNLVYIHNPAGGPDGVYLDRENFGAYVPMPLDTFKNSYYWGNSPTGKMYVMLVVNPPTAKPNIPWQEVLERNAGILSGGTAYMKTFADDLERSFGLTGEDLRSTLLRAINDPFDIGWVRREDAAAFIEGLAQMTGSKNLDDASIYLRYTAECFAEGKALLENKLQAGEIPDLSRVAETIRRAADYQEKAGESLIKGAKDVGAGISGPETGWKYVIVSAAIISALVIAFTVAFLRKYAKL
jgi:hypothetical protein